MYADRPDPRAVPPARGGSSAAVRLPGAAEFPGANGRGKLEAEQVMPLPPEARQARRFARLFVSLVAGWIFCQAGFNWLVNPWGLYAPHLFQARVVDERYKKSMLLQQYQPLPEQLVLGSSRMMRFEPVHLQQRTGFRTFNAAIPGAVPVDFLALYRYAAEDVRAPIRSVVLGLDTLIFFGGEGNYRALEVNTQLRRFLPEQKTMITDVGALAFLLSPAQSRDAWESLRHNFGLGKPRRDLWRVFEADGFQSENYQDEARGKAGWALDRVVRAQLQKRYMNPGQPNPVAFRDLDLLLALLEERQVATLVVLTPAVETVHEHWRHTGFMEREVVIRDRVRELAARHGARFVDYSSVKSFGGDPGEFYDSIHPTVVNTRRMIDALFPAPSARLTQAQEPTPDPPARQDRALQ